MAKNKSKQRREKRKKARKQTTMTTTTTTNNKKQLSCHEGLSNVFYNDENGRGLWIGGWKHGACFDQDTFVIDLTGDEHRFSKANMAEAFDKTAEKFLPFIKPAFAGWLSLPFPDYQTPKNITTYEQWYGIAMTIKDILNDDKDVLVACLGGHGRSGLFCAIVGYILNGWTDKNPVEAIRAMHCSLAVETDAQEQFVYDVLGLDYVADPTDYYTDYDYGTWNTWSNNTPTTAGTKFSKCPKCRTESLYIESMGHCMSCQSVTLSEKKEVMDITTEMLQSVDCPCENKNCLGSWTAKSCGHPVHDKIIIEGYCQWCTENGALNPAVKAEKVDTTDVKTACELCETLSKNAFYTGLCYECQDSFKVVAPEIHDTNTDAYASIPHKCSHESTCLGIVTGDVCRHTTHSRYIVDGLCPECFGKREARKMRKAE